MCNLDLTQNNQVKTFLLFNPGLKAFHKNLIYFPHLVPDCVTAVCLTLKALHVQEERDRLRLDFNELEERVNPHFSFILPSYPWCVQCLTALDSPRLLAAAPLYGI